MVFARLKNFCIYYYKASLEMFFMVYPLNELKSGETAEVVWIICESYMAEHLKRLGFIYTEPITCILKGRTDSISAYLIRGRLIGLRAANAKEVLVRAVEP